MCEEGREERRGGREGEEEGSRKEKGRKEVGGRKEQGSRGEWWDEGKEQRERGVRGKCMSKQEKREGRRKNNGSR